MEINKSIHNESESTLILSAGTVVFEEGCQPATLVIRNGLIDQIFPPDIEAEQIQSELAQKNEGANSNSILIINANGKYILPGFIDIHCDAIEKEVQPRPNTLFPLKMSLLEFERKLPLHGITTMYHSLSLGVGLSLRGYHLVDQMISAIHEYNQQRSLVRNLIHLRYEISYEDGLPMIERYIEEGLIDYLSYMDHSPGQGQYRQEGSFERYVMKNQGITVSEVKELVEDLLERRQMVDWDRLKKLAAVAKERGIAVASHDDDTEAKIDQLLENGITVTEFPITIEVARYAAERGMHICVGAPNVVRGASHDHNLRAEDAIMSAGADIICSDYHPASILHAVFTLHHNNGVPLHEAVKLATLNPARAMGLAGELGSIQQGKKADLLVIDQFQELPFVEKTIVDGKIVYSSQPYFQNDKGNY